MTVLPGVHDVSSDGAIATIARDVGFPLVLKAAAGGGGRGMRVVRSFDELPDAIRIARSEARSTFGDGRLLAERWVERGRHVEVQLVGTCNGRAIPLGTRDCSVQRRHQKVVEEAPAPFLPPALDAALVRSATALFERVGYQGAGTVEFLYDVEREAAFFLEVNTRLQVEHPVTEANFGIDLVAWQLAVASGRPLPNLDHGPRGHAIEVRLYAEDPITRLPGTGRIAALALPTGPGVRVDSAIRSGDTIGPHYDPLLAKIIAQGDSRDVALGRLIAALRQTTVLGTVTNLPLLHAICDHQGYADGSVEIGFLDAHAAALEADILRPPHDHEWQAIFAAWSAVEGSPRDRWRRAGAWSPMGWRATMLQVSDPAGRSLAERRAVIPPPGAAPGLAIRRPNDSLDLAIACRAYRVARPRQVVPTGLGGREKASVLAAPMPGTVLQILAAPGARVEAGQTIVILEAMKLQHRLAAPSRATVGRVHCAVGDLVAAGVALVELEPIAVETGSKEQS